MFHSTGDHITGHGTVDRMTDTGYLLVGGGFVPFTVVHPRPAAVGLVTFSDGTTYGGAR